MDKIGTHDSMTGETSVWWSIPLIPFARTQSKNLLEQFHSGCRLFDIRLKYVGGKWRGAHGWWFTKESATTLLKNLFETAKFHQQEIHVLLTYEGKAKNSNDFLNYVDEVIIPCRNEYVKFGQICSKYSDTTSGIVVDYAVLRNAEDKWIDRPTEQYFKPLDGRTWHTYIPIPFLWKQFFYKNVEFDSMTYKFVDFL